MPYLPLSSVIPQKCITLGYYIEQWTQNLRLKINETKSKHIIFTLRRWHFPPVYFNKAAIPRAESIKYLGLHFDKEFNWKKHVTTTRKHLNLKSREINWLIGKHSPLSMPNKLLIYTTVLRPVLTYGTGSHTFCVAEHFSGQKFVAEHYRRP